MSHDHAGMNMQMASDTTSSDSGAMHMMMTFHGRVLGDSLFSSSFTPSSSAGYFGAIVVLLILGILQRGLVAVLAYTERRSEQRQSKYARDLLQAAQAVEKDKARRGEAAKLQMHGFREHVVESTTGSVTSRVSSIISVPSKENKAVPAWRWSVDVPRGFVQTLVSGVGYLLMLAVMTGNLGYFFAVLGGILLGEVALGRYRFTRPA